MTTYVKPYHAPLMSPKKSFHSFFQDYELEHSFNKRLSCLVGVTVVSFIIGVAALSISILLLLQSTGYCGADMTTIEALHQRVEFLERQVGSSVNPPVTHVNPLLNMSASIPEAPEDPLVPHVPEKPVKSNPSPEDLAESNGVPITITEEPEEEMAPVHPVFGKPVGQEVPVRTAAPPPKETFDDDEDIGEGSGASECPQFARPICPMGMGICHTKAECPVPVCCRRK